MNIELYIAGQLCDLEKADLGIKLRRQLYNPKELNTKDSQKSYSITLPCTPRNNEIFEHKNVEETVGKFTLYPDARLYVNNILIMEGKFRLSSISADGYKGNLGVPAPLTAKDVFGERKMNDAGEWIIPFKGENSLTEYNTTLKDDGELRECIFPFVLYSQLPGSIEPKYTPSTKFALVNFPPSINCIQMLKKIFGNTGYTLSGTALDDERLKHLYVSYKNPDDFPLPFEAKFVQFRGEWTNWLGKDEYDKTHDGKSKEERAERKYAINKNEQLNSVIGNNKNYTHISCNLFNSDRFTISKIHDPAHLLNISNGNKVKYKVPKDGLYKIELDVRNIAFKMGAHNRVYDEGSGDQTIEFTSYYIGDPRKRAYRSFANVACELQLLRHTDEFFNPEEATMDNLFYRNNQPQEINKPNAIFPLPGNVNFIDPTQNPNILCGFSWGRFTSNNSNWQDAEQHLVETYQNPLAEAGQWTQPMAIKHGKPISGNVENQRQSAVFSPGYRTLEAPYTETDKLKVDLKAEAKSSISIDNFAYEGVSAAKSHLKGDGKIQQVVYLKAGEYISPVISQNRSSTGLTNDWILMDLDFWLTIEPFRDTSEWLEMDDEEGSSKPNSNMGWGDSSNLLKDGIDLIEFLPQEVKIDDWINNFNKAFNLELIHTGKKRFALNIKERNIVKNTSLVINLDQKTNVHQATNDTLALPRAYKLGFTIDTAEEGYVQSIPEGKDITEGDTGGGIFETGSDENNVVEQKSNFSYCWYKTLNKDQGEEAEVAVPVITDHELWTDGNNEMNSKVYFNKAQRFWFHYLDSHKTLQVHDTPSKIAIVKPIHKSEKSLKLDYHDEPDSILREFFTLLKYDKEYTCVECYLTPEEYEILPSAYVRLNGDLYNVVDADGFDPMGKQKTKLKLIKKL